MTGENSSDVLVVRVVSWAAAIGLAFAMILIANLPTLPAADASGVPAVQAFLVFEQKLPSTRARDLRTHSEFAAVAPSPNLDGEAAPLRLWSYNSAGQIVFDWPEQYSRCIAARARKASEADCPDPSETRELILRDGRRPSFTLAEAHTQRPYGEQ